MGINIDRVEHYGALYLIEFMWLDALFKSTQLENSAPVFGVKRFRHWDLGVQSK